MIRRTVTKILIIYLFVITDQSGIEQGYNQDLETYAESESRNSSFHALLEKSHDIGLNETRANGFVNEQMALSATSLHNESIPTTLISSGVQLKGMKDSDGIWSSHKRAKDCESSYPSNELKCKSEIPRYYFDPRKEACSYLHYADCDQKGLSFSTGLECFRYCSQTQLNHSEPFPNSERNAGNNETSENVMLTFLGNSHLYTDVSSDVDSDIFDILFEMRTYLPKANILSLIQEKKNGLGFRRTFNLILQNGKFGVEVRCNHWKKTYFMDIGGIQQGAWHIYYVLVDQSQGQILVQLNSRRQIFYEPNLKRGSDNVCSFFTSGEQTKLFIGGDSNAINRPMDENCSIGKGLIGCMTNVSIYHSSRFTAITDPSNLEEANTLNLVQSSQCLNSEQIGCPKMSPRVERVSNWTCGTSNQSHSSVLTLTGSDYLSYRLYNWDERLHTFSNEFSFTFKTVQNDAILFYATGENIDSTNDNFQFLSVALTGSDELDFHLNLGGEVVTVRLGEGLADDQWHQVSIVHDQDRIKFTVDESSKVKTILTENENYFFYLDPLIFVGGVPNLNRDCGLPPAVESSHDPHCQEEMLPRYFYSPKEGGCQNFTFSGCGGNKNNFENVLACLEECHVNGLHSFNSFSGCLRDIEVNGYRVLDDLLEERGKVLYHGVTRHIPLGCECKMESKPSLSFTTERSYLEVFRYAEELSFSLFIRWQSQPKEAILASGYVQFLDADYEWELRLSKEKISFVIPIDLVNISVNIIDWETWNGVYLQSDGKKIRLHDMSEESSEASLEEDILFRSLIRIGNKKLSEFSGFIGCISQIDIDEQILDLRSFVDTSMASSDIIMNNCQSSSPCEWLHICGLEGMCSMVNSEPKCDCEDTEWEGPTCHISKYRKSCEEYRALGYHKSGPFIIDVTELGYVNTAHVQCQFEKDNQTLTHVDHNVPQSFRNVKVDSQSFEMQVTYRDFNDEMLRDLIDNSEECYQNIKFSCGIDYNPFKDAWYSSAWNTHINYLGENPFGECHCEGYEQCYSHDKKSDEMGEYNGFTIRNKTSLPVTTITFIRKTNDSVPYSEPSLNLGQLICQSKVRREEKIRFESSSSYLLLPPWTRGDLRFKFRTTTAKGNILFQPSMNRNNPSFRIAISSEHSLEFVYVFKNEILRVEFEISDSLSNGKWNFVWVDYFKNNFRILVNDQVKIMELPLGKEILMLDGILVLGNILEEYREANDTEINNGFTGCIGDLIVNGKEVNIEEAASSISNNGELSLGCRAECDKNPCMNHAKCIELWTSYKCLCENPFAHLGNNCETDINENAITFTTDDSEVAHFNSHFISEDVNPLNANFTFNFRTSQSEALIFVAKDYIQNIIEIYLKSINEVVVLFNYDKELNEIIVNTKNISLNEGQSVQVAVQRFENETAVQVLSKGRTFTSLFGKGLSLMKDEDYEQYPYEILIGGVKSYGMTSDLPGLVGCFRGLSVNDKLLDFEDSKNWRFGSGIRLGCSPACEKQNQICKNGGYCVNNFGDGKSEYSCNCKGTSYIGELCNREVAYTFNGREDGMALSDWSLRFSEYFEISFAFASEPSSKDNEILVFSLLTNETSGETGEFVAMLKGENVIETSLLLPSTESRAAVVYADGGATNRHFVEVKYEEGGLRVNIDKRSVKPLTTSKAELPSNVHPQNQSFGLLVGGIDSLTNNESEILANTSNYRGCISNLHLKSDSMESWPLNDYRNGKEFIRFGLPKLGICSVFSKAKKGSVFYDFSKVPEWKQSEPEIQPVNVALDEPEFPKIEDETDATESNVTTQVTPPPLTAKIWPWALLGSFIFIVVLVVVVFLLNCYCKKSSSPDRAKADAEFAVAISQIPPPPPKLAMKESIPLLEKEPVRSIKRRPEPSSPPYGLAPRNSYVDYPQRIENVPVKSSTDKEVPKPDTSQGVKSMPIPLNNIDRKSNTKISFKNQLSTDTNTLRHIDSSSADSLNSERLSGVAPGRQNTLPESPLFERLDELSNETNVDDKKDNSTPKEDLDSADASSASVEDRNESIKREMDLKKYYLTKKASMPPKLPPKTK